MTREALALAAALAVATPALAQTISADEAREIARGQGMETVEEIELDDGRWEVEGRDVQGEELELEIDAESGLVVDIDD